jgi:hypothetical protein
MPHARLTHKVHICHKSSLPTDSCKRDNPCSPMQKKKTVERKSYPEKNPQLILSQKEVTYLQVKPSPRKRATDNAASCYT